MMKRCLGFFLLLCLGMFHLGSALRCYECSGKNECEITKDCTAEDACLSLSEKGGTRVRRCIKYSDCNFNTLSVQFPTYASFKFSCCQSNLCNSGNAVKMTTPILVLLGALLSGFWCWI